MWDKNYTPPLPFMLLGVYLWDKVLSRAEKRLSAKEVLAAKKPGRYADGAGLYLIVGDNQNKRWVLRIQVNGRRCDFGLGSLRKVSLVIAREKANKLRTQYLNGLDPAFERNLLKILCWVGTPPLHPVICKC